MIVLVQLKVFFDLPLPHLQIYGGWVFLSHPLISTASCCCLQGLALSWAVQGTPEAGGCSTGRDVPALQCSVEQQDSSERLGDGNCRWRNSKPRHISWKERPREAVILVSQVVPSITDGMLLVPVRCWSQTTSQLVACLDSFCFYLSLQLPQNFLAERENLFCFLENWGSPCTLTICFHKIPPFPDTSEGQPNKQVLNPGRGFTRLYSCKYSVFPGNHQ